MWTVITNGDLPDEREPEFPQSVVWGLAVGVVLVAAEYARRSSSSG